ncbi:hypothetical protein EOE18_14675 [Novosphingobium umbonatum]|uniref:Uncharacterized protein n=1 Tax=Novosphingobium umbonatum TaxID=1908524 RepID=A0A3S2VBS2_9SPHN|nr:hypothetical protein [Novosphingobium umbonatum]RVU03813.1 hypothetical protein EOE18_14675 [Novosphingobium umbonatum]
MRFLWQEWAFVLESDREPDSAREYAELIAANAENDAFLRCLAACAEQRRNVSHQPGINYAPKIFAGMPEAKGTKKLAFARAMERLLHTKKIELDCVLWAGDNRHPKRGIRLAGESVEPTGEPPAPEP